MPLNRLEAAGDVFGGLFGSKLCRLRALWWEPMARTFSVAWLGSLVFGYSLTKLLFWMSSEVLEPLCVRAGLRACVWCASVIVCGCVSVCVCARAGASVYGCSSFCWSACMRSCACAYACVSMYYAQMNACVCVKNSSCEYACFLFVSV